MDKGYDMGRVYTECEDRNVRGIIPLHETTALARGDHPATCQHGEWRFAGTVEVRHRPRSRTPVAFAPRLAALCAVGGFRAWV